MCVFFQSFDSSLFNIEALKRMVRGMDTMSLSSLISLGCIWSAPGALDMFSFFSLFLNVSASMWRSSILIWPYFFHFRVVVTGFCGEK